LYLDRQLGPLGSMNGAVPGGGDQTPFGEQLHCARHHTRLGVRVNGKASGGGRIVVSDGREKGRHELGPRQEGGESSEPEPSAGSGS
jgi:ribosomal protein L34